MATKAAYQRKLEAQLKEWDAQLDLWSAKAGKATASARIDYENELDSLKSKLATARNTLDGLVKRSDDAWEDMQGATEQVWDDMNASIRKAAARFK